MGTKGTKGMFIAIEGVDGSGKSTQARLLMEYFRRRDTSALLVKFPRYGAPGAYFVEKYLHGDYGSADALPAEVPAIFYALDRFDAKETISRALREGKIVLADRYFASNLAHQGGKIKKEKEQRSFMKWLYHLEYEVFRIPKPDMSIFLDVPFKLSYSLLKKRSGKKKRRDVHEASVLHLKRAYEAYHTALALFPGDYKRIDCTSRGELLPPDEIQTKFFAVIPKRFSLR